MPTNPLFDFSSRLNTNEQKLYDSLVRESIQVMGQNCLYIPRVVTNFDQLYITDAQSTYKDTYLIEVYLKNVTGFGGDKTFMSKFGGLEIRDQVTFVMSITAFQSLITPFVGYDRPHEGDLIFWPLNQKCFQVKFIDKYVMYYPLGSLYAYEITTELFEYSDEVFNTGIPEIDILQTKFSTNAFDWGLLDEKGNQLVDENNEILVLEGYKMQAIEPISTNEALEQRGHPLINFSETDPYSQGNSN